MRAVSVDPADRTAWVQGGALWGDVDHRRRSFACLFGAALSRAKPSKRSSPRSRNSPGRYGPRARSGVTDQIRGAL
ncbi:hypothetical protein [Streptomyces olindensis]|uniref:hypothetical protein n=1 Tax=Streptomyces olindensis TaxID=358823 RepID=UPI003667E870